MELILIFILNVVVFILGVVLRLALYSAKITLSLISKPVNWSAKKALKGIKDGKNNPLMGSASLVAYLGLKALIATLNLLIIIIDLLTFLLATFGILLGTVVALLILTVIVAGTYIIILNDCSVGSSGSSATKATESSPASNSGEAGNSEAAGMGNLTEEAKSWAKSWELTYIGDSLGAGSESQFMSAFPKAIYESDPSRGLVSIKGVQTGETAIQTLKRLVGENKVKSNLVVAIGTNNDMSSEAMQQFYDEIPSSVKTITWVLTASEGGVDNASINSTIKNFVNSHDNMRYLDWKTYVDNNGGWSSYQGGDNIHMSADGASKYVDFQTQGLYDLYGGGSSYTESSSSLEETARGLSSFISNADILLSNSLTSSRKLARYAEDISSVYSDKLVHAEDEGKESKSGCNFSTSKVSDGSSNDSSSKSSVSGGNLLEDGTGSHSLSPSGYGLDFTPDELPDELKKYAINPESVGMKYGAPWEGSSSSINSNGWFDFTDVFGAEWAGQCTEFAASINWNLWEKDGEHFHNVQGNGVDVVGFITSKAGIPTLKDPKAGAIFSSSPNHVGIVSHVFENGDVLIIEQNGDKSGMGAGKPNTWNYRLIAKADLSTQCNMGYAYLGDAGYTMNPNVKSMG